MAKVKKKARKLVREKAWAVVWKAGQGVAIARGVTEYAVFAFKRTACISRDERMYSMPHNLEVVPVEIRELPAKKAGGRRKK